MQQIPHAAAINCNVRASVAVEVTDISLDELSEVDRLRLEDPVLRSSREAIDAYLEQLRLSAATAKAGASSSGGAQSGAQSGAEAPQSGNTAESGAEGVG